MSNPSSHLRTLVLHAGYRTDQAAKAVAVPIYQSAAFAFDSTEHAADLFALKEFGNVYSRIANATCDVFEQRMAALEGGAAALAVASGQAATAMAVQNIAHAGDNIVSSTDLYDGTWNLFANTLRTCGIEVRFADPSDPENFRRLTDARTRAYFAETLPNPKLQVFPIAEVAAIGEELGVPLIVYNTAAPLICRPFDHGAHIVVYSVTKYIGGHGTSIGGMIIDGGRLDWERHARSRIRARPGGRQTRRTAADGAGEGILAPLRGAVLPQLAPAGGSGPGGHGSGAGPARPRRPARALPWHGSGFDPDTSGTSFNALEPAPETLQALRMRPCGRIRSSGA